ncbi:MAG: S-layer homology domain-containing protein [Gudongella sp.]|nr:S-layer homology domain-containing protein [Gudongella sp.]
MFKNNKRILSFIMAFMMMLNVFNIDFVNGEELDSPEDGMTAEEFFASEAAKLNFEAIKKNNSLADDVRYDLELPTNDSSYNAEITWESSDSSLVSDSGKVTRPEVGESDVEVTLTATVSKGLMYDWDLNYPGEIIPATKKITIIIKAISQEEYDEQLIDSKKVVDYALDNITIDDLTFIGGGDLNPNAVNYDLQLLDPRNYFDESINPKVTVDYKKEGYWTSSNPEVLTVNYLRGKVIRPAVGEPDVIVTLTLRATKDLYSDTKDFDLTIKAITQEEIDAEIALLQRVKNELTFEVIKKDNTNGPTAVISNLQAVYRGILEDDKITWKTTNKGDVGAEIEWTYGSMISYGAVTRPTTQDKESYAEATISSILLKDQVTPLTQRIPLTILADVKEDTLSKITLDEELIEKALDLTDNKFQYETSVAADKDSIMVSAEGNGTLISINGSTTTIDYQALEIDLLVGMNTITITSKRDGSDILNTYTLRIIRPSEENVQVSVRIEGVDESFVPKTEIEVVNFDLKDYGLDTSMPYTNAMHALIKALEAKGFDAKNKSTIEVTSSGFVFSIREVGDSEFSWVYTVNGKMLGTPISEYALQAGDDITFLCVDWLNGYLSEFDKEEYKVTVDENIRLELSGESMLDLTFGNPSSKIGIEGAEILIGENSKLSADTETGILTNEQGEATISFDKEGTYLISAVKRNSEKVIISRPYAKIIVVPKKVVNIAELLESLSSLPEFKDSFGDWQIMEMAAYGKDDNLTKIEEFLENAKNIASKESVSSTDLERITLSLTSLGYDVTAFDTGKESTINIIEKIANYNKEADTPTLGTIYGYLFALKAYDSGEYNLSEDALWTRDRVINYLIDTLQKDDGGWDFGLDKTKPSEPDATAMTITALSSYMDTPKVADAVNKGIELLASMYQNDSGYLSWGSKNSNSASMVIIALSSLGIDADTDIRFVKEDISVLDNLLSFKTDDNRFGYTNTKYSGFSTEQAFRALVAYNGFKTSNKAFNIYKFSKPIVEEEEIEEPGDNTGDNTGGSTGGGSVSTKDMEVTFKLIGDSKHGSPDKHEKFETWINKTIFTIKENSSVKDLFIKVLKVEEISYEIEGSNYVSSINGLSEMDNGPNSGWKYSVNNKEATKGFADYELEDGDEVLWYYTDDYTKDSDSVSSGSGGRAVGEQIDPSTNPLEEVKEDIVFKDLVDDYWANNYIYYLANNNILNGKTKDSFAPENKITRAEFMTMLYRISGQELIDANNQFIDVKDNDWFSKAVSFGTKTGITAGISKTEFAPSLNITREQMAVMIVRFLNYIEFDLSLNNTEVSFEDKELIAEYARDAVEMMQKAGIISGKNNNEFDPKNDATRAEAAKILAMIMQEINK